MTGPYEWEQQLAQAGSAFALGRIGGPRDVARIVGFLASADAACITGAVIDCTGGQTGPVRRT